jgi:pyruvate dehydrogenase E2 component (dihydrolipoamide acetyltransferase)
MIYEVTMPSLGADMDKGRLVEWKIKVGDHIDKDQEIAIIETQKAAVEMDSFRAGKITELIAKPDEFYPVGAVLAKMELDAAADVGVPQAPLAQLPKAAPEKQPTEVEANFVDIREAVAKAMSRSKKEIPHYYLKIRVGVDPLINFLDEMNKSRSSEDRVLMPALLVAAVAEALKVFPLMNGFYVDGKFSSSSDINIGMAIALKSGGVIAPALIKVQTKNIFDINSDLKGLIERAREAKLKLSEISEGTVTITNIGDLGSHEVMGVIFPPQVALIGFGQIHKEPVVDGSTVRPGFIVDVTLSADHRVSDGLSGSKFLQKLADILSDPKVLSPAGQK